MSTTRLDERLLASLGRLQAAPVRFETARNMPPGEMLCALPAVLVLGLLWHSQEHFCLPSRLYPLESIYLMSAFLALVRAKSLEAPSYEPRGEWDKLAGRDRIPEQRTLRVKIGRLRSEAAGVQDCSRALAQDCTSESLG